MEAVASVVKASLNGVLSGAKSAIAEEAALKQAVQRDQAFLTDELAAMQSFLKAADEERNRHKVPRSRVRQVRHLAYDVEDCLEEYSVHLEKPSGWRLVRTVLERHRIAEEIKGLRARVEDSGQRNLRYHLVEDPNSNPEAYSAGRANTIVSAGGKQEVNFFFESREVDLLPLIQKDDQELRVIAIWGTSSDSKKTAIIRRAYDDLKRNGTFECYAWIRVMHPFDPSEFLQCVMRQFYVNSHEEAGNNTHEATSSLGVHVHKKMMNQDKFVDEFVEHVTQRSYLIVLNDLSTIEDWDWVKTYFPKTDKGSRIIVSTEYGEVASLCAGPERLIVELKQSFDDQTIYAFCEKGDGKTPITRIEMMDHDFKESQFMRRHEEISDIISKLLSDSQELEVVSVCGKGGIGKTTLVKSIYRDEELRAKFGKHAYVTIKHPLNHKDLLESLIKQLDDKEVSSHVQKTKQGGRQRLDGLLEGKKYLIVFDDLLSTTEWDTIIYLFSKTRASGSRIIITTSIDSIAKHCSQKDENIHRLQILKETDAHNLFMETVFGGIIDLDGQYPELAKEAESILRLCNGFPLAIITIGGVLAKRPKTLVEWKKLKEYIGAELETNPELEPIRTILDKCYDCLPYDLKSCFLYLSVFPEDHIISRRRLVNRWTAEGYSSHVHGKDAKEIADSYFRELIDRSMIEPFLESIGHRKGPDSCKVNNRIHEMSTLKSVEENLVVRLEEGCGIHTRSKIRHLSVISDNWNRGRTEFENIVNLATVRSLTVFGKWRPYFISEEMRMLRVLDLEGTTGLNDHHLEHIGKLLHLKYLSLRGCRDFTYLPHSWGKLRQLETLDIQHTAIIKLPKAIIKLGKLQYLRVGGYGAHGGIPYEEAVESVQLPKLLRNKFCVLAACSVGCCVACCAPQAFPAWETGGDPNRCDVCIAFCCNGFPYVVRSLDPRGVVVPSGVDKLTALHTLATVNIRRGKAVLQDIRRLTRLRKLGVVGVNKRNGGEFCLVLSALSDLESLSVRSAGMPGLHGCLESDDLLYSPPGNLKSLKLDGNLVKFPGWISGLHNLVKLTLWSSRIEEHDPTLQILGKLPKLTTLQLVLDPFQGLQGGEICLTFVGDSFPNLKVLKLILINDLKSVEFKGGAMPKLEVLQFCGLASKTNARFFSGVTSLPRLREFMLDSDDYTEDFLKDLKDQLAASKARPILKRY